jgi:hypothetical protein
MNDFLAPAKQVLVISTILQHRNVTYKDILDADLVVVSFSFLVYVCAPLSEVVLACALHAKFFLSFFLFSLLLAATKTTRECAQAVSRRAWAMMTRSWRQGGAHS